MPGLPYAISFQSGNSRSSPGDTSLSFSYGDCPSSPACSSLEPSHPPENVSCLIRLRPFKVKCIDFSMGILYVLLVSAFIGWAFSHHSQERRPGSTMEALLGEAAPVDKFMKDEIDGPIDGPTMKYNASPYSRNRQPLSCLTLDLLQSLARFQANFGTKVFASRTLP